MNFEDDDKDWDWKELKRKLFEDRVVQAKLAGFALGAAMGYYFDFHPVGTLLNAWLFSVLLREIASFPGWFNGKKEADGEPPSNET